MWGPNVSCQLKFWPFVGKRARLFTGPLFFRKFVRIERLPVRAAILVLYVPRGGRWGSRSRAGGDKNSPPILASSQTVPRPPRAKILHSSKMAARNTKSSITMILRKIGGNKQSSKKGVF